MNSVVRHEESVGVRPLEARSLRSGRIPWANAACATLLWALVAGTFVSFVVISALRLPCAVELGNTDGLMMDHIQRIARGQPLYVEPTLRFIPLAYTPLFPVLVAPLTQWFGPAFWTARMVDVGATALLAGLLFWVVRRETSKALLGAAAAAVYLLGHGLARGNYDAVRPDPLMLLLAFGGLACLRFTTSRRGAVIAGLLGAAAFFAKQHGILFGLAALPYLAFRDRRRLAAYALTLLGAWLGTFALLAAWLGPWFTFYVFDVPSHWSKFRHLRMTSFVVSELFGRFAFLALPTLFSLAVRGAWRGPSALWAWAALGGVATGLLAMLDPYAYLHVLIPSLAALSLAGPIALDRIARALGNRRATDWPLPAALSLVLALQLFSLRYPVRDMVPNPHSRPVHDAFASWLGRQPGPVMVPFHGYYADRAGKGTSLHVLPLDDILRSRGNRLLRRDPGYFSRMFDSLRVGPGRPLIVSDTTFAEFGGESRALWQSLAGHYRAEPLPEPWHVGLRPVAGNHNAPALVYRPVP